MIIYVFIYRYSCDEGINWYNFSFTDAPVTVWGVITEPGLTTTQVLLVKHYHLTFK